MVWAVLLEIASEVRMKAEIIERVNEGKEDNEGSSSKERKRDGHSKSVR